MNQLGNLAKALNPIKALKSAAGGWVGAALKIGTTVVQGLAAGEPVREVLKGVAKDVAVLAIKTAITAFTGGPAGRFVGALLDSAHGILSTVAAHVEASAVLPKPAATKAARQLTTFSKSLTAPTVRRELTKVVLDAAGLRAESDRLDRTKLDAAHLEKHFTALLKRRAARVGGAKPA